MIRAIKDAAVSVLDWMFSRFMNWLFPKGKDEKDMDGEQGS